jgi:hypothetical protein
MFPLCVAPKVRGGMHIFVKRLTGEVTTGVSVRCRAVICRRRLFVSFFVSLWLFVCAVQCETSDTIEMVRYRLGQAMTGFDRLELLCTPAHALKLTQHLEAAFGTALLPPLSKLVVEYLFHVSSDFLEPDSIRLIFAVHKFISAALCRGVQPLISIAVVCAVRCRASNWNWVAHWLIT